MAKARGVLRLVPRALVGRFRDPREGVHIRQPWCADQDAVSVLGAGGAGGGLFAPGKCCVWPRTGRRPGIRSRTAA
jgi:hypothetical protein